MPARWNDELTYKYVELYKEHECLWNMNSTLYKRKDARQSALEEIEKWDWRTSLQKTLNRKSKD
jgi:hypothetical protein